MITALKFTRFQNQGDQAAQTLHIDKWRMDNHFQTSPKKHDVPPTKHNVLLLLNKIKHTRQHFTSREYPLKENLNALFTIFGIYQGYLVFVKYFCMWSL